MPRNSSGVYTLPESAFVAGTTIRSAPVNSDFSDIATALTQSLATTGVSSMTGPIKAAAGSQAAPSYTFASDTGTGFFLSGASEFKWVANGVIGATFAADLSVTFIGNVTIGGTLSVTGALSFASITGNNITGKYLSIIATATTTAAIFGNTLNDTAEHILNSFQLGTGAGSTILFAAVGGGANDISEWRTYLGAQGIFNFNATQFKTTVNFAVGSFIRLLSAGYADLVEVTASVASPSANTARLYSRDDGSGRTSLYYMDSAGSETPLGTPGNIIGYGSTIYTGTSLLSTIIPLDNSIPQNTEGDEFATLSYTVKKSSSKLLIQLNGMCFAQTNGVNASIAVFKNTDADAIYATTSQQKNSGGSVGGPYNMNFIFEYTPGAAGTITFKFRAGPNLASNIAFNCIDSAPTRGFGGVAAVTITVQEILQ